MKDSIKTAKDYKEYIDEALNDQFLRRTLDKFAVDYRASREAMFSEIDGKEIITDSNKSILDIAAHGRIIHQV